MRTPSLAWSQLVAVLTAWSLQASVPLSVVLGAYVVSLYLAISVENALGDQDE